MLAVQRAQGLFKEFFPEKGTKTGLPELSDCAQHGGQLCPDCGGFDTTAYSLHVGHLPVLSGLFHFQRADHKATAGVGDATMSLGDPQAGSRTKERKELDAEQAQSNARALCRGFKAVLH